MQHSLWCRSTSCWSHSPSCAAPRCRASKISPRSEIFSTFRNLMRAQLSGIMQDWSELSMRIRPENATQITQFDKCEMQKFDSRLWEVASAARIRNHATLSPLFHETCSSGLYILPDWIEMPLMQPRRLFSSIFAPWSTYFSLRGCVAPSVLWDELAQPLKDNFALQSSSQKFLHSFESIIFLALLTPISLWFLLWLFISVVFRL